MAKKFQKCTELLKKSQEKKSRHEFDRWLEEFLNYLSIEKNCSKLTIRNYQHYLKIMVQKTLKIL